MKGDYESEKSTKILLFLLCNKKIVTFVSKEIMWKHGNKGKADRAFLCIAQINAFIRATVEKQVAVMLRYNN